MLKSWWFGPGLLAVLACVAVVISQGPLSKTGNHEWTPRAPGPHQTLTHVSALTALEAGSAAFIPNQGQWDHPASYVARIGAGTVFVEDDGWVLALEEAAERPGPEPAWKRTPWKEEPPSPRRGVALRLRFEGASPAAVTPEQRLGGVHHYFLGNDPERWRTDVPRFGAVRLSGLHPGIDACLRERQGHLEYDLLLDPGADLEQVVVHLEGADRLTIDTDGTLVAHTALGPVRQPRPTTWQVAPDGTREPLACDYLLLGPDRFGFVAPAWAGDLALVVDPGLIWTTFFAALSPSDIELGPGNTPTMAGGTGTAIYPTTQGAYSTTLGGTHDATITRLSADGSQLLWSTFLGGPYSDNAFALEVDAAGVVTVAGDCYGGGFPITAGAFDTTYNGGGGPGDVFVARLSANGSQLIWSTYLGGTGNELPSGLAVDAAGTVTVAGSTTSSNFPTTPGAFDPTYNPTTLPGPGFSEVFVARLSASGSQLLWSTYLGGSGKDRLSTSPGGDALALDPSGAVTVAGGTMSPDFPTTAGAYDTTWNGNWTVFVSRLSGNGSQLMWSTFLGTAVNPSSGVNLLQSTPKIAVDPLGAVTVAGLTSLPGFPTTLGAFAPAYPGGNFSGFVARLSSSGAQLLWSTFLGGPNNGDIGGVVLDPAGAVTVTGWDFPTTPGSYDPTPPGNLARLDASGSRLIYSTHLSVGGDVVTLGDRGGAVHAGGGSVAYFDMLPTGVAAYGSSSPGCSGPLAIGVTSWPQVGNALFSFTCNNGPPMGLGVLGIADASLTTPITAGGAQIYVDPLPPSFLVLHGVTANAVGAAETIVPIPANPSLANLSAFAQYVWYDPCPPTGYTASNALAITVQP